MSSAASETSASETPTQETAPRRFSLWEVIANAVRGFLIGMVELIPGISGGTVALVVGIYERLLEQASAIIATAKAVITDRSSVPGRLRNLDWALLLPTAVFMVVAVFVMSGPLTTFVTAYPGVSRALFMGMVAVSIIVPLRMVYAPDLKNKPWVWILFVLAAIATFIGTGFTAAPQENPSLLIIFLAAAVAVCALALPGVSGSFFLLAVGLYEPVMGSLSDRDWAVIGIFILGALTGIVLFIRVLRWLLDRHRTVALVTMSGLMLGSLRALWPWQDSEATLLAPGPDWPQMLLWTLLGAGVVALMIYIEYRTPQRPAHIIDDVDPA
ncbi:MAG TPA: DUF368 domain-containing protein [Corynebacterium sp.]|nr:DUF368 domain-containing protein [Corynebacterium sp.]